MRGVEDDEVRPGAKQRLGTGFAVLAHADGSAHQQATSIILHRHGVLLDLVDVLDGDESLETVLVVDHKELFDAVLVQVTLGLVKANALGHGDEVSAGHDFGDERGALGDEADVAVGDDAHEVLAANHGQAGNSVLFHDVHDLAQRVLGVHGDGIVDHAGLGLLDAIHLAGLFADGKVLVDDACPAVTGHGNGHAGFGDGVHGRRDERYVQGN